MNVKFLISKCKGNDGLHARFIFDKSDNNSAVNKTAALCMENKK